MSTTPRPSWLQLIFAFLLDLVLRSLKWALGFGLFVLPFAALLGSSMKDHSLEATFAFSVMGAILGALMGAGQTFVHWFSDSEYSDPNSELRLHSMPMRWGLRATLGPLGGALGMVYLLANEDHSCARPGRGRRALVGAIVGALLGLGFILLCKATSTNVYQRLDWQAMLGVATVGSVACGVAGLCSDAL